MQYLRPLVEENVGFWEHREDGILSWVTEVGVCQTHKGIPGKENTTYKGAWLIQGHLNCGWNRRLNISFLPKMKELFEDRYFALCLFHISYSTWALRLSCSFIYMPISCSSTIYQYIDPDGRAHILESFISCMVNKSYIGWIHV